MNLTIVISMLALFELTKEHRQIVCIQDDSV